MLKIFHLSHSDIHGGAARAAYRIHHSLLDIGLESQMFVNLSSSGDWTVTGPNSNWHKAIVRIRPQIVRPLTSLLRTSNRVLHSPSIIPSRWPSRLNKSDADIVHLHWIQNEMVSIGDIHRIKKPIVWTLHDMWAICGAEHISHDIRWREGYASLNRPSYESCFDLNRFIWYLKLRSWRNPIHIICPSRWLASCVESSPLMLNWPVEVIPNPIDTHRWHPVDQGFARKLLGLPQNCKLLLFGAMGGLTDPNKGFHHLEQALVKLSVDYQISDLQLVLFGQRALKDPPPLPFPTHFIGHLHDDFSLKALYSAADLMVVPSLLESFGQTASEAHACGTPVVAFNTSGLRDVVDHGVSGFLAEPYDPASLAHMIHMVFKDSSIRHSMGLAARLRAEQLWTPCKVAEAYSKIYQRLTHN